MAEYSRYNKNYPIRLDIADAAFYHGFQQDLRAFVEHRADSATANAMPIMVLGTGT